VVAIAVPGSVAEGIYEWWSLELCASGRIRVTRKTLWLKDRSSTDPPDGDWRKDRLSTTSSAIRNPKKRRETEKTEDESEERYLALKGRGI